MKKHILILSAAAAICIILSLAAFGPLTGQSDGSAENGISDKTCAWEGYPITHAMGAVDGYTYSNSLEAFDASYCLGQRVFEVDLQLTSDNFLVCAHDWEYSSQWSDHVPTSEEFLNTKIYGLYTALSIEDLLKLMQEHEDIYIVTDSKYPDEETVALQFGLLLDAAVKNGLEEVLDRIIVQIYNDNMYSAVKDVYDFPYIIYTLYQVWDGNTESFAHYLDFCTGHNISHITMWDYLASEEIINTASDCAVHILVHTVNDTDAAKKLIDMGVESIYTDYITPEVLEKMRE